MLAWLFTLGSALANFKVNGIYIDPKGIEDFLNNNASVKAIFTDLGEQVAAEAQATADSAQRGSGGTITGYAEAGFSVEWERRSGRPRVNVVSNADPETFLRAYFYTQKRDGVAHLRRALYKFTKRGA